MVCTVAQIVITASLRGSTAHRSPLPLVWGGYHAAAKRSLAVLRGINTPFVGLLLTCCINPAKTSAILNAAGLAPG